MNIIGRCGLWGGGSAYVVWGVGGCSGLREAVGVGWGRRLARDPWLVVREKSEIRSSKSSAGHLAAETNSNDQNVKFKTRH